MSCASKLEFLKVSEKKVLKVIFDLDLAVNQLHMCVTWIMQCKTT